jgi:hypothetical protein
MAWSNLNRLDECLPAWRCARKPDLYNAVPRLEIVEDEIQGPIHATCVGRDIYPARDIFPVNPHIEGVLTRAEFPSDCELYPRVISAGTHGGIDPKIASMGTIAIKLRVCSARDLTEGGICPPKRRDRIDQGGGAAHKLGRGPPRMSRCITIIASRRKTKDEALDLTRTGARGEVRRAKSGRALRTTDSDKRAFRVRIPAAARDHFECVWPLS